MRMPLHEINRIIQDRFRRWGGFLESQLATPIVLIGLRSADNRVIVTTCEEVTDEQILDCLLVAIAALEKGRVSRQ
jgi:hypothetical protein